MEKPTYLVAEKAGCAACSFGPVALVISAVSYPACFPWYVGAAV